MYWTAVHTYSYAAYDVIASNFDSGIYLLRYNDRYGFVSKY